MQYSYPIALLAVLASSVSAGGLTINNWCNADVYVYQSVNGACNTGANGKCGSSGWKIPAGKGSSSTQHFDFIDKQSVSLKVSKVKWDGINQQPPLLQYEYAVTDNLYWDLSDLDGSGSGRPGSPFHGDNVKITPTGDVSHSDSCKQFRCPANQTCKDAYNTPSQVATRACPTDTGTQWLDLCEPSKQFNSKREVAFMA